MTEPALAPQACEHCRKKKLKCTRQLPKCERCKPWPGPCVYSVRERKPASAVSQTRAANHTDNHDVHSTLQGGSWCGVPWATRESTGSLASSKASLDQDHGTSKHHLSLGILDEAAAYVPDHGVVNNLRQHFGTVGLGSGGSDFPHAVGAGLSYWTPDEGTAEYLLDGEFVDLYTQPSLDNARGLMLLSAHFPDKFTPTRLWTLVTHAAKMVLALNLHKNPSEREILHAGPMETQQRMLMFRFIFSMDQSLALTFGRPPTIPKDDCEILGTKLGIIDGYTPHLNTTQVQSIKQGILYKHLHLGTGYSRKFERDCFLLNYSQVHLHTRLGLDTILMRITRPAEAAAKGQKKRSVLADLDDWFEQVKRLQINRIVGELSDRETETERPWMEIHLGVSYLFFQGYHTKVLEAYHTNPHATLSAALSALAILPRLSASEQSVFNGVAWQLLYQPFTPFFVVFTECLSSRSLMHLEHLHHLPTFLEHMREHSEVALQLKRVADAFLNLATRAVNTSSSTMLDTAHWNDETPSGYAESNWTGLGTINSKDRAKTFLQHEALTKGPLISQANGTSKETLNEFLQSSTSSPQNLGKRKRGELAERVNPYFDWFSWAFQHDET
ncbi:MAG: hypothetical protein Q9159_005817 [Coniocarpon cinnabarinum]